MLFRIRYTTMSRAVVVVGRVGQFSSNTTNTLLENLMSCLIKNVKHDLPTFKLFKQVFSYVWGIIAMFIKLSSTLATACRDISTF